MKREIVLPPGIFVCRGRLGTSVLQLVVVLVFRADIFAGFGFSSSLFAWRVGHVLVSRLGGLIFMSLVSGN